MTKSIPKIKCKIYKKFLYNLEFESDELIDCEIIGISAYLNQPLTFHVLIGGQSIFSDIPIHAVCKSITKEMEVPEDLLSHINCPDYNIDVFILDELKSKKPTAFFKKIKSWFKGYYLLTVDFYQENELMHLIELKNGQFAFVPNHKIVWNENIELPNYKKLKQNWSLI